MARPGFSLDGASLAWSIGIAGVFLAFTAFLTASILGIPAVAGLDAVGSFLLIVPVAVIVEEVFFRYFLQGVLGLSGMPAWMVWLVTGAAFSAFHVLLWTGGYYSAASSPLIGAFLYGTLASVAVGVTGNLAIPLVAHAVINLIAWSGI